MTAWDLICVYSEAQNWRGCLWVRADAHRNVSGSQLCPLRGPTSNVTPGAVTPQCPGLDSHVPPSAESNRCVGDMGDSGAQAGDTQGVSYQEIANGLENNEGHRS